MRKIKFVDDAIPVSGKVMYWVETVGSIRIIPVRKRPTSGRTTWVDTAYSCPKTTNIRPDHVKEHHKFQKITEPNLAVRRTIDGEMVSQE
jgi:hypothetical protein